MDPGLLKLLDDDEDDNAPTAADVDAFAAVLKGDLGGTAHGADRVAGAANGTLQSLPQSPATSVSTGHTSGKTVPVVPTSMPSGQQQHLIWNHLSTEQQREVFQRRAMQQQQQQRLQQQQQMQQQQQQQQNQQPAQPQELGSSSTGSGNRRSMAKEGISFTALMPLLQPHLPSEQGQQLSGLYQRFKRNEITREDFIRGARVIAGDQVLVQTIRQMHMKQQVQLQHQQNQQKLQQQQLQPQLQPQQQPHLPQQHSCQQQSQLPQSISAVSSSPTLSEDPLQQQEQQQSQDPTNAVQQNMQPLSQTQEVTVTNGAHQILPQAHQFQQTQVPSSADHDTVSQAIQPQSNLPSSLPQTQLQSSPLKQGDQQQDLGKRQQPSNNTTSQILSQQVRHEVDDSPVALQSANQQSPATFPSMQLRPSTSAAFSLQTSMVAGAGQPSQPYSQTGLPQQSLPVHLQLQQPQPGAQAVGPLTLPVSHATPPQQPQLEKPLTKYAKQKLRKEQKKREEEERQRKQAEEDSVKKLQTTPSCAVTTAHQCLHPQVTNPQPVSISVELNKQSYSHGGSLAQQAQLQTSVAKVDKLAPISPGGLVALGRGPSLLSVKQEPSDLQSEQNRQAFQIPKFSDLLPGQAAQNPGGQTQFSDTAVLPPSSNANHVQVQGSSAEQVQNFTPQGSVALCSPCTIPSSAQEAGMASMPVPGGVPIPSLAGISGVQSTLPIKQIGGLQRMGSLPTAVPGTCAYNSISLHPVMSFSYAAAPAGQTAAAMTTTPNKTATKKPAVGQKKSVESTPSQQPPSKKQKVSAGEPDQSLDQLNDVTAVSGVNLKEEEEQLLVGPKETSGTTEAMRKIAQEEEERLFLEREPLRARLGVIATQCGVKIVSEDVGRCLSMSVEERLRSMLCKLIKFSRQRCDAEKERHKVVFTSDVRRQILLLKRKAKEMLDKKLAEESERLRKLNEKDKGSLPEVERDEIKAKAQKALQEEDDRLKANAANVAARAAVGADDMLLKWQMMAEQGRQKRQGGEIGAAEEAAANRAGFSGDSVVAKNSVKKLQSTDPAAVGLGSMDAQGPPGASETGRRPGPGASRLRRPLIAKSGRGERTVTVKDVISLLETEPQMSKSTLLYCLYERQCR